SGFKFGAGWARGRDNSGTGPVPVTDNTGTVVGTTPPAWGPANSACGVDYTDNSACGAWSVMAGYDAANWGVAGGYDVIKGSGETVPTNWNRLTRDQEDRRWNI